MKAKFITERLTIKPEDQLVDIGGGTGEVCAAIRNLVTMTKPAVCVDPSKEMLDIASKKEGIITVLATGEEFLSSKAEYELNVVLMNSCVHHFFICVFDLYSCK